MGRRESKIALLKAQIRECQYIPDKFLLQEMDYGSFHSPDPFINYKENVGFKLISGLTNPNGNLEGILGIGKVYYADLLKAQALDRENILAFLEATPGHDVTLLDFGP